MGKYKEAKRIQVESSTIKSIYHSKTKKLLEIEFYKDRKREKGTSIYSYTPITESGFEALKEANSIGGYFHKFIKNNSSLECTKIE